MMANTFGVPNGAALFIYDKYDKFQTLTTTCGKNPDYANYCFYPASNSDGDYVSVVVHGYAIHNPNDVSFIRIKNYKIIHLTILTIIILDILASIYSC